MDAPRESTILASKFEHREIGRQHSTEIAQCLQRSHLRIGEHTMCAPSRDGRSRTGLIGRRVRRAVRGCARRRSPAHVDIVARRSAVGCRSEEKRICVSRREGCTRWGDWRLQPLGSECGVERVCEGQPQHGAVIGLRLWALRGRLSWPALPRLVCRPAFSGLPGSPGRPDRPGRVVLPVYRFFNRLASRITTL